MAKSDNLRKEREKLVELFAKQTIDFETQIEKIDNSYSRSTGRNRLRYCMR